MHAELSHPDVHYSYPIVKNQTKNLLVSDDLKSQWLKMLQESPSMMPEQWLYLLDAGNSQPAIHVNEAAEILRMSSFPPFSSDIKFFVIWLPERLGTDAANKLLKVIEEPAPGICFLMVSNNELEVLPTIFSRTQRIHLGAIDERLIASYLQKRWRLDATSAAHLASLSAGSLAKADSLGSNSGELIEFRTFFQSLMRDAYARKIANLKKSADNAAAFGREKIIRLLAFIQSMFRENFIYNMKIPRLNTLDDADNMFAKKFAPFINAGNIESLMEETDNARIDIERNGNAKIVLFDYFIRIITQLRK